MCGFLSNADICWNLGYGNGGYAENEWVLQRIIQISNETIDDIDNFDELRAGHLYNFLQRQ